MTMSSLNVDPFQTPILLPTTKNSLRPEPLPTFFDRSQIVKEVLVSSLSLMTEQIAPCRSSEDEKFNGEKEVRTIREARQRVVLRAMNMHDPAHPSHSDGKRSKKKAVHRSKSADYGYGSLFLTSNRDRRRSNRHDSASGFEKRPLHEKGRRTTGRSLSDSICYRSKQTTLIECTRNSALTLSKCQSSKGPIAQGPDSFVSSNENSKKTSSAPQKPKRRKSIGEDTLVTKVAGEDISSFHDSVVSCPGSFVGVRNGQPNCAPSRSSSPCSHDESMPLLEILSSSIGSIELHWPDSNEALNLGSQNTNESTPRKPTRRLSNSGTEVTVESSDVDSFLASSGPMNGQSSVILNGSFASIGREHIFEDPNRLCSASPQKTPRKEKDISESSGSFHLSMELSFSEGTTFVSDDALTHDLTSIDLSETRRCAI